MRSYLVVCLLLSAANCCCYRHVEAEEMARVVLPAGEARAREALEMRIDAAFDRAPLSEAAKTLSEKAGLEVRVDRQALKAAGVDETVTVSGEFHNARLRSVLDRLLPRRDLTYDAEAVGERPRIAITTYDAIGERRHTAIAPVGDLLAPLKTVEELSLDRDSLLEAITLALSEDGWYGDDTVTLAFVGDSLVIRNSWREVEHALQYIEALRRAREIAERCGRNPPTATAVGANVADNAAVEAALERPIDIEFREGRLEDALRELAAKAMTPIDIDHQSLDDAGIDEQRVFTAPVRRGPLSSVLFHLLDPADLTWVVIDESVLVTTPEQADELQQTLLFPAIDLLQRYDGGFDVDSLIELIGTCVAPDSWPEYSGPTPIDLVFGALSFPQCQGVNREVERLLTTYRHVQGEYAKGGDGSLAATFAESAADAAVRERLSKTTEFKFEATSLNEALAQLAAKHEVPVVCHSSAFEDLRIAQTAPVTGEVREMNLGVALDSLLSPLGLTYEIAYGAVRVTTPHYRQPQLPIAFYPVHDLAPPEPAELWSAQVYGAPREPSRLEQLMELIRQTPDRNLWDYEGGPGSVMAIDNPPALVIAQSEAVHRQVAELLTRLRAAQVGVAPVKLDERSANDDAPIQRVFRLELGADGKPLAPADDLAKLIRKVVEPEAWSEPQALLESAHIALVVKHRPSVVKKVYALLREIGALDERPPGWRRWQPTIPPNAQQPAQGGGGFF